MVPLSRVVLMTVPWIPLVVGGIMARVNVPFRITVLTMIAVAGVSSVSIPALVYQAISHGPDPAPAG